MGDRGVPVADPSYDYLVAGASPPVQGAVAKHGVVEEREPFICGAVADDSKAGALEPPPDGLMAINRLLAAEVS